MHNIYTKLSWNFIKKNILTYSLILIAIAISVFTVFVPYVSAKSQSINYKNVVKNLYTDYPAISQDATNEEVEKIEKNPNVSKAIVSKNFGFLTSSKSNVEYKVNGFNKEYLKMNNDIILEGRAPTRNNEVLLDKKYSKSEGNIKIGDYISGVNNTEYGNEKDHKIYSTKERFKVVGFIEKNSKYKKAFSQIENKEKVLESPSLWIYENQKYPKEISNYTVYIKFKTGMRNLYGNCIKLGIDVAKDPDKVIQNFEMARLNESITNVSRNRDDIVLIIISGVFILSLFKLLSDIRLKNLGLVKILGIKKSKVYSMLVMENLILAVLGLFIGFIASYIGAYKAIGGPNITSSAININLEKYKVYFGANDILLITSIVLIPVIINVIYLVAKYNHTAGLNLLNSDQSMKIKNINLDKFKVQDIVSKVAIISFMKNIFNYILPMLIIIVIGSSIINIMGVEKIMDRDHTEYNVSEKYYLDRNYYITNKGGVSVNSGIDESKLKDIRKYKNFTENLEVYGYVSPDLNRIDKNTLSMYAINPKKQDKYEFDCTITGIDTAREKELESKGILDEKTISLMKSKDDVYAIFNNLYYNKPTNKYEHFIKGLKNNQIIELKVPCIEDGVETFKLVKTRVIQAKKENDFIEASSAKAKSNIEVIFDLGTLKKLTNINKVTTVRFDVDSKEQVKLVDKRFGDKFAYELNDREKNREDKKILREQTYFKRIKFRIGFYTIVLMFSLAFSVRIMTEKKKRDMGIMNLIGASKKTIKKMLVAENIIFITTSILIAVLIGVGRVYKFYNKAYKMDMYYKGISHYKFTLPYNTIIVFIILVMLVSMLIQAYSNNKLIHRK